MRSEAWTYQRYDQLDVLHTANMANRHTTPTQNLVLSFYTAPSTSPASINNADDIEVSTTAVLKDMLMTTMDKWPKTYDGILIACYSAHPLVGQLYSMFPETLVTGIFEASILAALPLVRVKHPTLARGGWGIITTGQFWEDHLTHAVQVFAGQRAEDSKASFEGVFTTGLNASDFHGGVSPKLLREKLFNATKRLLKGAQVDCIIMGCAGMAGLEEIIRSAVKEVYGESDADYVFIIDGVRAGVGVLEQMVKNKRMFLPH